MLDLSDIECGGRFAADPRSPVRLALVHLSPRMELRRRRDDDWQLSSHFPGLGLLNLARSLQVDGERGRLGAIDGRPHVRYFDEEAVQDPDRFVADIGEWLSDSPRQIIGMSAYTWNLEQLNALLDRFDPTRILRVVGGPHATLAPDVDSAHVVVRGEGGAALRHIITTFGTAEFGTGEDAAGICFRRGNDHRVAKPAYDRSLAEIPSPAFAYDVLPERNVTPLYSAGVKRVIGDRPQIYVCTQSCRARCTFCSTYLIHGRAVARPVEMIAADLHHLVDDLGHDSIEFHDDDLLQHPEFDRLLDVLVELHTPWFCYGRVSTIDLAVAQRMAAAGCKRIFLGVEAMDDATLAYFNKQATADENRRAVEALDAAGIGVVAGFIVGAPDHTLDQILEQIEEFARLNLLFLNVSVLSPDPGTIEFRRARLRGWDLPSASRRGLRVVPDPVRFGSASPFGLPTVCDTVTKPVLNELAEYAEIRFTLRPEQLERIESVMTRGRQRELLRLYVTSLVERAETLAHIASVPDVVAGCQRAVKSTIDATQHLARAL